MEFLFYPGGRASSSSGMMSKLQTSRTTIRRGPEIKIPNGAGPFLA